MKGIILSGGIGSRLAPMTHVISKQLLPVYDKPMIYYPLSTLILSGITDILIISAPDQIELYRKLLGDGSQIGISISHQPQNHPGGLAEAFIIGDRFIDNSPSCLILGDNLFYGADLGSIFSRMIKENLGATILGYYTQHPENYGVIEFDHKGNVISLEEKPESPKSKYAAVGIYFYDTTVTDRVKELKPSSRGELEITCLNNLYLKDQSLKAGCLGRGYAWMDMGTIDTYLLAAQFIASVESRQGLKIGCIEEAAYRMGLIDGEQILKIANQYPIANLYGSYLKSILDI